MVILPMLTVMISMISSSRSSVSCRDSGCGHGVLFVQLGVFIVLLCQVCSESRDIILSASLWNALFGCRMNNIHKAIIVFRGWINVTYMRVSKSVEKAFQLAFLKLKRRRKGIGVCVTAALIKMAIGQCWVCGIGSSTALLLSDVMRSCCEGKVRVVSAFPKAAIERAGELRVMY